MKSFLILLCIGLIHVHAGVLGQKITLTLQDVTVKQALKEIEKQCDFVFMYDFTKVNVNQKIDLKVENESVETLLNRITRITNSRYEIIDRQIVLIPNQQLSITGTVTDENGDAMPGVNIMIKGTTTGIISDLNGKYTIMVPGSESVLVFSFIGYVKQEIPVGTQRIINITLAEDTQQIEEVVVTALGMKRSEKALGYATQKVGGDQFEKVKGVNVATSMTGRISGLTVLNSTEFMQDPELKLRGEDPLLVIDGVPYGNMKLADVNSDDILNIDVLKGATASALYGSRGGNGAIMITTKKGGKKGFTVTVNSSNMFNMGTLALPKVQSSYSAGYNGKYNTEDEVWGDKLDIGRVYKQWDPIAKEMRESELTSKGKNNFKDFLEFSFISNTNLSVTQQGENGSFRTSFSYLYNKGQYPNARAQQFNYTVGGEMRLGDKVSIDGTMAFNKRIAPNTSGTGYGDQGYIYNLLIWTGPEYQLTDYRDYWIRPDQEQNWHYDGWYDNPYLMAYEKLNTIDFNKLNGMFSINYEIVPWAKVLFRTGMDYYSNLTYRRAPIGINSDRNWGGTDKGYYQERNEQGYSINSDLILMAEKRIGKLSIDGLFGGTLYFLKTNKLQSTTRNGLSVPGFYSLKASVETPLAEVETKRKQVNSLFGKITLGYMNAFYLDVTGRNDWSSTLPKDEQSYFYPSVGGSVIMSELISLPEWMNFWKLRGSWTISKEDLDIYAIDKSYELNNSVWDGMNSANYPEVLRGNVKPITHRTYEFGTAMHFLNNRLKFDFSFYNKLTYYNTTEVEISSMSGYKKLLINTDEEYVRRGYEIMVDATPVIAGDFNWNVLVNWSSSRRYYAQLDPVYSADKLWVYKGARADPYEAKDFMRDSYGNLIHYNGFLKLSDYRSRIGYLDPNWIWGITNTFSYKKLTLTVSVDGRVGGMSNSETNRRMWQTGAHPDSDTQWRYEEVVNGNKTFVGEGVTVVSGDVTFDPYGRITQDTRVYAPNTEVVSYESYIKGNWRQGPQLYFDETFLKLRELSLSYEIPASIAGVLGMSSASISLVGQNLLLWTKEYKYADPDRATDDLASPSIRYMGFNLKFAF